MVAAAFSVPDKDPDINIEPVAEDSAPAGASAMEAAAVPQESSPKPQAEVPELCPFKLGEKVITTARKNKDELDDKDAEVLELKQRKGVGWLAKVKMLDGPLKGDKKEFPVRNLKKVLTLPAGQDENHQRAQAAHELFGDLRE